MADSTSDGAAEALLVWSIVTLEAAARALAADETGFHVRGDCAVALIGMRDTLRAAEWLLQELGEECEARWVPQAFDEVFPGTVAARDALEHFDEYGQGKGRLQRRDPAQSFALSVSRMDGVLTVDVGPYVFDVALVQAAVRLWTVHLLASVPMEPAEVEKAEAMLADILGSQA